MRKINLKGKSIKEIVLNHKEKLSDKMINRRGNATLSAIVISAIILIALILLNTPIRTFISNMWDTFSTFIETKLTTLFGS